LHQVLMNLSVNARDAMPQGGQLTISAVNHRILPGDRPLDLNLSAGDYVRINVKDTGNGIPLHQIDRIFDPFYTTKEVGKGTGLGLSAVLGIVKSHGGYIDVKSEVNCGSLFEVYLPACHAPDSENLAPEPLPAGKQQSILVVDDEAAIRELITTTLETYNYQVITAHSGSHALTLYADQTLGIDLVLMDVMMPEMDGYAAANGLHQLRSDLKIVAMSGLSSAEAIAQAEKFGCRYFLAKPFTTQELLETIDFAWHDS
jgi:two-component system, cell cycle sensor histidine kinase and response regulator CckA